jgi:nucleoside-diphosphate-sugar epimerase
VAQAHLLAYKTEAAANQRYLISNRSFSYQQIVDLIEEKFPELKIKLPTGETGQALPDVYQLDTSKAQKELGIKFRSFEETFVDTVDSLRALEKKLST